MFILGQESGAREVRKQEEGEPEGVEKRTRSMLYLLGFLATAADLREVKGSERRARVNNCNTCFL